MRLIFDTASILLTNLLVGKDPEGYTYTCPETKKETYINTAEYAFDRAVQTFTSYINTFGIAPKDCVFVLEGSKGTVGRSRQVPNYNKQRTSKAPPQWEEYAKLRQTLSDTFLALGSQFCWQDNVEGDDVIGYLALNSNEPVAVVTNDNDMSVLNGTNLKGHRVIVAVNGKVGGNKFGDWPFKYITLYKSLVGDTSDNIKGIYLFGEKAFEKLIDEIGLDGLEELDQLAATNRIQEIEPGDSRLLNKIVENFKTVYDSYRLAQIRVQDVNNPSLGMIEWKVGMVKDAPAYIEPGIKKGWYAQALLIDNSEFDSMLPAILTRIGLSPHVSLDIETATTEESDAWLDNQKKRDSDSTGIDVYGQNLVSLQLTFGDNNQYSCYFPVNNKDTDNIPKEKLAKFISDLNGKVQWVIQNVSFELSVLQREFGFMLTNVHDTKLLASYVDENDGTGLKKLSKRYLGYDQVSYADVTQGRKMSELTADEAFTYGCDDTRTTIALFNHFRLVCELEDSWKVYNEVEIDPAYLTADAFNKGTKISLSKMKELADIDKAAAEKAWATLRQFLIESGWSGTAPPVYGVEPSTAEVKEAFQIVLGRPLKTLVKKFDRLVKVIAELEGEENFANILSKATDEEGAADFTRFVQAHFAGEPDFNIDSPVQMKKLMYEVLGLEQRVFNKATDTQYAKAKAQGNYGRIQGTPKTDDLAIQYALKFDCETRPGLQPILEALQTLKVSATRFKLYYEPYQHLTHWTDGLLRSSFNQCATNTRRYTSSGPNLQQLPKHPKAGGEPSRFREIFVPHKKNAVVVSMDFSAQELRVIADYSQDPNMLACYMGDTPKDMHLLTGMGIAQRKLPQFSEVTYPEFAAIYEDPSHPEFKTVKAMRTLGKKVNFTTEYGAQAPKLAQTMLISEAEAQIYIDARMEAFAVSDEWKKSVVQEAKRLGYVTTKLGARRHLNAAFKSGDSQTVSKAERQAVNFMIQGSSAEMTKLAMGRMWRKKIFERFDARFIGVIHDEAVASCAVEDLIPFMEEMHWCMVQPYGGMMVPIASSISFGPNFGEQYEIGESVQEEVVNSVLEKMGMLQPA